jgi:hydroxymethylpyrimidine pyrophosphatase-like HAD family hydrolase
MSLPIYVDIDGTLTDSPNPNGKPLTRRIDKVRIWLREGRQVVVWSGNGMDYAREFCRRHGLHPTAVLGKPVYCIDADRKYPINVLEARAPETLDT